MPLLYDHAKKIVEEDKPVAGVFLGTGSTKTRICLFLARGKRALIICPKTQWADRNWQRELEKINLEKKDFYIDITVISKETFRRDWERLPAFDVVICDEVHTMLGVTPNIQWVKKKPVPKASQLFNALESYLKKYPPQRLYLATATIVKSPMTVWAAAKILGKEINFYEFRDQFYIRLPVPGREIWVTKKDSASKDALAALVKEIGYVGRLEDYFDVPDQTHRVEKIELTPEQKKRIKEVAIEFPDPIVRVGKINQIEQGILSGDEFNESEAFAENKVDRILELSEEFSRMIVFVKYTAQIDLISKALKDIGKKVYILDGRTKDKGQVIKDANADEDYVLIAQAQISSGWEVPLCPVVVFASKTYSFVDYDQSLGRVQRANNIKKNLYIHLVAAGGVDEAVHRCVMEKRDFSERLYEGS